MFLARIEKVIEFSFHALLFLSAVFADIPLSGRLIPLVGQEFGWGGLVDGSLHF